MRIIVKLPLVDSSIDGAALRRRGGTRDDDSKFEKKNTMANFVVEQAGRCSDEWKMQTVCDGRRFTGGRRTVRCRVASLPCSDVKSEARKSRAFAKHCDGVRDAVSR